MDKKIFLWLHMHQPDYLESLTNRVLLPWVRRHSLNGYYSVPKLLLEAEFKANINFSGILIEQIKRYQDGIKDVYQVYEEMDPDSLTESELNFICERFTVPASFESKRINQIKEKHKSGERLTQQEILDLQVLFKLSAFAPIDEEVVELRKKDAYFTKEDKKVLIELEKRIINTLFDLYKKLLERNQIEITITPHHHPILPLLLDLSNAKQSKTDAKIPNLETHFYGDAKLHIERAIKIAKEVFNISPVGMWPAEGSISKDTIDLIKEYNINWIGSDELLVRPFGFGQGIYEYNGIKLFLRNHAVSDKIGFIYNKMDVPSSISDLKQEVERNNTLVLILDGENPWEYFRNYGVDFMKGLFGGFKSNETLLGSEVEHVTHIDNLKPGSWINGFFDTWIGHEETNIAWTYLIEARNSVKSEKSIEELLKAEGSDYFWWYSDFHKKIINFDFDYIFRGRLIKAYLESSIDVPSYLYYTIKRFP